MHQTPVEMIGQEGTARATLFPARTEHEVIHNQLASAVEEAGQSLPAVRSLEDILFFNLLPGQFAALPAQLIPQFAELLLFAKQVFPAGDPFLWRNHLVFLNSRGRSCCSHSYSPI